MTIHLRREIDGLKKKILSLSTLAEENLQRAVRAFIDYDLALADTVIRNDEAIDEAEVDVEEECLKLLALHQPVAMDLRLIVSTLKINSDLERIGDLAVTIARRTRDLKRRQPIEIEADLQGMAVRVQNMVHESIDALVNLDTALARSICVADKAVDETYRAVFEEVKLRIADQPEQTNRLMAIFTVTRSLERIADHATNIAEDVIYMIEGGIIRHKHEEIESGTGSA